MAYISLTDAKTWIAANIYKPPTIADADLQVLINVAEKAIDALPFQGVRYEPRYLWNGSQRDINNDGVTQVNEFPRFIGTYGAGKGFVWNGYVAEWDYGTQKAVVPHEIRDANIYEALALYEFNNDPDLPLRRKLQDSGVASVGFGGSSESYILGANRVNMGLKSRNAYQSLRRYLLTTAPIR
jgi:hypothetical protein